ncbi:MAG: hypothetical protein AB7D57_03675 [Desulfovibrionaceae bacterium]
MDITTDIFQINVLDWFAIWGALLVILVVLMWATRETEADRAGKDDERYVCSEAGKHRLVHPEGSA